MKIKFCGADREVTGSCHLLETKGKKILVDCGMYQGGNFNEGKNSDDFPFDPKTIDVVLITHAHLDHIGRLPKLIKDGFSGKIFITKASRDFARLIWEDAYGIMKENNKRYDSPILFDLDDVDVTYNMCEDVNYNEQIEILPDVKVIFKDAGHIFGAAFIELATEGKVIAFSGDIGNENVPILRDTQSLGEIDVLLVESTYGDRIHESEGMRRSVILKLLKEAIAKKGTIMIPAFSLERTQELLYELNNLIEYDHALPKVPIFLDSPLAIKATAVYKKYPEYYDVDAKHLHNMGDDFLDFPGLKSTLRTEQSKKINNMPGPKIVIAGAGMMNGGRIVHHAFHNLSDPNSTLIIVGYQANGTLGRRLYEGADKVKIFRQDVKVKATVKAIGALSAHGDQKKLIDWVGGAKKIPKKIFCVHGEPKSATELAHRLRDVYSGVETFVPEYEDEVEI